ncbi:MAG: hypothetical protein ACYC7B_14485 [Burkholderiales bacterium]
MIDAYLANRRKIETDRQLTDAGEELLFTGAVIEDLERAAKKVGATESERMQTLLRIRATMAKKRRAEGKKRSTPRLEPEPAVEKAHDKGQKKQR